MKKVIAAGMLLSLLSGWLACTPVTSPAAAPTVTTTVASGESRGKIEELTKQLSQFKSDYDNLQNKYQSDTGGTQGKIEELAKSLTTVQASYDSLQKSYDTLVKSSGQSGLRNPSWAEVKEFLRRDDTDAFKYDKQTFDCSGYALILRDRIRRLGMRVAYIEIELPGVGGHALNAFETTDKGLVYIDNTEGDKVAYVKSGQQYGTIQLDGVRAEYIACDVNPGEFWRPLSYKKAANPFAYDYYLDYQQRQDFYHKGIDAFNAAAAEFNRGSSRLTIAQLNTWRDNLKALEQDLGTIFYEPLGVVGNVQTYWGDK